MNFFEAAPVFQTQNAAFRTQSVAFGTRNVAFQTQSVAFRTQNVAVRHSNSLEINELARLKTRNKTSFKIEKQQAKN